LENAVASKDDKLKGGLDIAYASGRAAVIQDVAARAKSAAEDKKFAEQASDKLGLSGDVATRRAQGAP
jgi:hypothetical protein